MCVRVSVCESVCFGGRTRQTENWRSSQKRQMLGLFPAQSHHTFGDLWQKSEHHLCRHASFPFIKRVTQIQDTVALCQLVCKPSKDEVYCRSEFGLHFFVGRSAVTSICNNLWQWRQLESNHMSWVSRHYLLSPWCLLTSEVLLLNFWCQTAFKRCFVYFPLFCLE